MDFIYVAIVVGFFVLTIGLAYAFDRLLRRGA
jgi:hypothetical protein